MSESLGTLSVTLDAIATKFNAEMKKAEKELENIEGLADSVGLAATAAFAAGAIGIGKMISVASDAAEQMNVIESSFGDLTPAVLSWADATADAVGRSVFQMREFAGTTQAMLAPMVGAREAAAEMSTQIAQLAVDLGSYYNVADDEALQALKAGLIGSSEPMRRFGAVMTEASLQAFALSKGISGSVREMNEAQKVALRYQFIMDRTALAQGDAARTAGGYANATKKVAGQVRDLAAKFGEALLPAAEGVLAAISGMLKLMIRLPQPVKTVGAVVLAAGTAFSGLVAAGAAWVKMLPALKAGFAATTTAIKTFGMAFTKILAPILAVAAAIGAVITLRDAMIARGYLEATPEERAAASQRVAGLQGARNEGDVMGFAGEFIKTSFANLFRPLEGVLQAATDNLSDFGKKTDEASKTFGDASKKIDKIMRGGAGGGFDFESLPFEGFGEEFVANLEGDLNDGFDFAGIDETGKAFGKAFDDLSGSIQHEWDIAGTSFEQKVSAGLERTGNILTAVFDSVRDQFTDLSASANQILGIAGGILTGAAMAQAGERTSAVLGGASEGFQSGGIFGAIIGAIAGLSSTTEGFGKIMATLEDSLEPVQKILGGLFDAISPLIKIATDFGNALSGVTLIAEGFDELGKIGPAAEEATKIATKDLEDELFGGPNFKALEAALFGAENGPLKLVGLFDEMARSGATFDDAQKRLKEMFGQGGELLPSQITDEWVRRLKDLFGVMDASQAQVQGPLGEAADAISLFSETIKETTEALTNVPEGFKVAAARFAAIMTDADNRPSIAGGGDGGGGGGGGGGITFTGNVTIVTPDVKGFREQLEREARFQRFAKNGTPIDTPPFGGG
jgi:hypothetical protein